MKNIVILIWFLSLAGCASSELKTFDLDSAYRHGRYDELVEMLQHKIKDSDSKDQLMWQLNLALAYQAQGKYRDSNNLLLAIKEKIQWSDFLNVPVETLTLVLNEKYKKFNLAEYEQFLVQVYIALNYALQNKWQEALVEMRSADLALYHLRQVNEHFKMVDKYHLAYLSGVIYEANGKYDEAYIDYERLFKARASLPNLPYDLFRTAYLAKRYALAQEYRQKFALPDSYVKYIEQGIFRQQGEVVIFFQNGMAPFKTVSKRWGNLPEYQPRLSQVITAPIAIDYEDWGTTTVLVDLEKLALDLYEAQYKTMLAKDVARSSLKEAASWVVGASGGFVGIVVTRQIAHSTTEPDLRSWFLLPKEFQISRLRLKPGEHKIQLNYTPSNIENKLIKVQANKMQLVPFKFGNDL